MLGVIVGLVLVLLGTNAIVPAVRALVGGSPRWAGTSPEVLTLLIAVSFQQLVMVWVAVRGMKGGAGPGRGPVDPAFPKPASYEADLALLLEGSWSEDGAVIDGPVRAHPRSPARRLWREVRAGAGFGVILLGANLAADRLSAALWSGLLGAEVVREQLSRETAQWQQLFAPAQPSWVIGLAFLLVTVTAPLSEELFFRGYAHAVFRRHLGRWAVVASSGLFAAIHLYVIHFIPIFLLGVLLAFLMESRRNLVAPVVAHGVMNALVALAVLWSRPG